ncbi:uncharacterized protein LOC116615274 [Nematostella vectensis]|uniref:uncharacterized protein LOC116615274 n=1 Tax=Nematostella vectensis TaxID=45351 RepID=UPI0020776509|nr:uncharacterized protein LOC116615274 [Nematostella vectensis]
MPLTRSQAAQRNNSVSNKLHPTLGSKTTKRTKRRRQAATSKNSKEHNIKTSPKSDNLKTKIDEIIWKLIEQYFPVWLKIVLTPFKANSLAVCVVVVLTVAIYPFWGKIVASFSAIWKRQASEINNMYVNEVSWPPRHRWIWRDEVSNITEHIQVFSRNHPRKQIHVYFIGGPGAGKSELARQVGLRLYKSKRHNNRPLDVVTIEASSMASLLSSLTRVVLALYSNSSTKSNGIKQMQEEFDFKMADMFSIEGEQKTEMKLRIRLAKLMELFSERKSRPVVIFDNVKDLKLLFNNLNLEPGSSQFVATVMVTLQKRVPLNRLSSYVQVWDLYEGMSQGDSVKLLQVMTGLREDNASLDLARMLDFQPLALETAAIYIESVREGPPRRWDYTFADYISEFQRDIHSLGMEEEVEWQESEASKYPIPMYAATLKAVNRSAQRDPVFRDIVCIGYTDSSPLSLSFVLDYLKRNSREEFTESQIRNSLRNVLFKVTGKQGQQSLSSHQVIREAFRQICKWSNERKERRAGDLP